MSEYPKNEIFFPPEWHEQDAVLLTWPHVQTDWAYMLTEVEKVFLEIARVICKREKLVITAQEVDLVKSLFSEEESDNILFFEIPSNDTWSRDHGPICTYFKGKPVINDFRFNGWGNKFNAFLDNQITSRLQELHAFHPEAIFRSHPDFILEGGSIETDGDGTLLTTSECLLKSGRNRNFSKTEIESKLKNMLGVSRILWLYHGFLEGDDTDSHIDTLVRFCNKSTLCFVRCNDKTDVHYTELKKMERQLQEFRTVDGEPYQLVGLPMVQPLFDKGSIRMPATYANFLIINTAVLVPVYGQEEDGEALEILGGIFPDREIIGINCLPIIKQNGSLHCLTMQIPKGFLR
jgi:agmatine deiminase